MSDGRLDLCICGMPRWRHPRNEEDREVIAYTTSSVNQPHHLFLDPPEAPNVVRFLRLPNGRLQAMDKKGLD